MIYALGVIEFDPWFETCMKEYEAAQQTLAASPLPGDNNLTDSKSKILLLTAKNRQARRLYDEVDRKAQVAALIRQIKENNPNGEIYINIPDLEVQFTW